MNRLDFAVARLEIALMAIKPGALVESEEVAALRTHLRVLDDALVEAFPNVRGTDYFTDSTDGYLIAGKDATDG